MSDRDHTSDFDALRDEACAWVVRIQSGQASATDTADLLRWRAQSPEHARALGEAVRLRRLMVDAARASRAVDGRADDDRLHRASFVGPPRLARRAFLGGAIAASVGGVMMLRPPLGLWPSLAELQSDYRTGTGERRKIALANGASVELNTRTSVLLRPGAQQDGLELIAGEVVVDVARSLKPVAIRTGVGAAFTRNGRFGVRLQGQDACVTCSAGQVAIRTSHGQQLELGAGQQATFAADAIGTVAQVDAARVEAWRTGRLIFVDEPLGHVVDELNRYRPGKIILTNPDLRGRPVNAVFLLDRLDSAVLQIREVAGAKASELPGAIILLS